MSTEERITYISSKIKKYKDEPLYQIEIETLNNFEILINGFPVYTHNHLLPGTIKLNINPALLKSGSQNLEVKLYPRYNSQNIQNEFLSNKDSFILKMEKTSWKDGSLEEPELIINYELPKYKTDNHGEPDYEKPIDYSKQNELIKNFNFTAKIPYELKGWSESEDLSKVDKEILMNKISNFYYTAIDAFKAKNYDYLNTLYLNADIEWYQSEYFSKETIRKFQSKEGRKGKSISTTKANTTLYEQKMFSQKDSKLELYCDNRVIRLVHSSGPNKGNSAFGYEDIDQNGMKREIFIDLFLHIPKGSKELEIIR
ncbi:hypothetical protein [Flavobacterium hercynium]|nr:hypothetical protein [Flavobacterium hercynium]